MKHTLVYEVRCNYCIIIKYHSVEFSFKGAQTSSVSIDDLRQQHVRIMQLLDLSTILPLINKKRIIPKEDYDKVADTKHHGSIERTGYLLHALYKQGQVAVDQFMQCLHETKDENPKHVQILQLFEGGLPDLPTRSPIFEILDQSLDDIERLIELMPFLSTLLDAGVISVSKFMDLQSPDRPLKENLERLFRTLEEQGTQGFIKFMSCLQKEGASTTHQHLFAILFEKGEVRRINVQHVQHCMLSLHYLIPPRVTGSGEFPVTMA